MKSKILRECTILDIFPSAIEYDDYTALNDDEEKALNDWLANLYREAEHNHGPRADLYFEYGVDTEEFALCDILNVRGDCVTCQVLVMY